MTDTRLTLRVDDGRCAASGNCVRVALELFETDDWGYASVRGDGVVPAGSEELARRAEQDCPTGAITGVAGGLR